MQGRSIWKEISQAFLRGVLLLLPVFVSFYFLIWLANGLDGLFKKLFTTFAPTFEVPFGLGLIAGLVVIFLVGISSDFFVAQFISDVIEKAVLKIPLIGSIFKSLKNVTGYLNPGNTNARGKTVIITYPDKNIKMVGFLTQSDLTKFPNGLNSDNRVAVYLPFSYMVGGITVFVEKQNVQETDMSFEKAMQGILTGWMQGEDKK